MITIDVEMNDELFNAIDIIDIYNIDGGLIQYSKYPFESKTYHFFFAVDKKFCGTELSMQFNKMLEHDKPTLRRATMSTILEYKITVPLIEIKGDTKCSICLEHVDDNNNKCVLNCKHVFHMDCIYQYIKSNNLLKPLDKMCKRFNCPHTEKFLQFPCPICNTII
jgi:hypothetical protein